MGRRRILILFVVLGLMVLSAGIGWVAASRIISPAEAAARTAPPTPSPILVPVEERVLTSDIVTRGTARYGLPQSVSLVPSALKLSIGLITTLPLRNTQLKEGDVALTVSGRPVFILQGDTPTYRDLVPGNSGEDVHQLELALKRLGFDPGEVDKVYDAQTSAAVAAWYESAGWQAFGPTTDQLTKIRTLEQDLALAKSKRATAYNAVSTADLAVQAARANAESANIAASADVGVKTRAKDRIWADREAYDGEERANAAAALAAAQTAETATRLAGQAAIQAALDAQTAAAREAKLAADAVTRLEADLEAANSKVGVQIPADEVIFVPALPVRVGQINAVVGDPASGPVMAVTDNRLAIDSSLALDEAPLVKPGLPVSIDEPALGIKADGVVSKVADTPGTFGVDGFHIYFEVQVTETSAALEGFSLRLTVPVKSTGTAVTVVPISALFLAADGTSRVQLDNNGSLEFITVEPGLSANGFVEVKPVEDRTLTAGQLVVVGFETKQ
jgi:peptidoglycan hydrolase-like protein with peptidoglycan-binding domain